MGPKQNTVPESIPTPLRHIWLVCIALSVATFAIYAQVLQFEFVSWDDDQYIYENRHVAQGVTKSSLAWALTSGYASNWHPLTWISHMVDIELFGVERGEGESILQGPGGHHLVSVLIHMANSLLLLWLLYRMTGAFWTSALTAALFALHPLRVESVAWVSERKDVLSGLFFMLTLLAYQGYAKHPSLKRYLLVFISLALGLMAKPMLVTVPFVLLLLDLWPLRRWELPDPSSLPPNPHLLRNHTPNPHRISGLRLGLGLRSGSGLRFLILEKLPLFALVLASCLVTVLVQQAGGSVASLDGLPWAWRLVNAPVATVMYLFKTLWPTHLAYAHPHPANLSSAQLGDWILPACAAFAFLAVVSVVAVRSVRKQPFLLVGWLLFLGMLFPVIGLMQVGHHAWADRYTYLPMVGIYVALSGALAQLIHFRPALRQAAIVVVSAVLLLLLPVTAQQVGVWRDSQSLYEHALAVTRNNYEAHNDLGDVLAQAGQYGEAVEQFNQSLQIKPDYAQAHGNLAISLANLGRSRESVMHHKEALRIKPKLAGANYNWGTVLQEMGQFEEAITYYRRAIEFDPAYAEGYNNLGVCLSKSGRADEAVAHFQEALRLNPKYAEAHNNMGFIFTDRGQLVEALKAFETAARLKPEFVAARDNARRLREFLAEE
jgi:tetratricopeptide (TPR) repeat protein